jgi:hypothetical protein
MISTNVYGDHLASLMKFCKDFATQLNVVDEDPFEPVLLDAYDDYEQLPKGSLIGVAGYAIDIDEHIVSVKVMIGIGTENDTNTFRLTAAMNKLVQRLLPTKRLDVVDCETGALLGVMTIENGVRVMPASNAGGRTMKYVAFMAQSGVTVDLGS